MNDRVTEGELRAKFARVFLIGLQAPGALPALLRIAERQMRKYGRFDHALRMQELADAIERRGYALFCEISRHPRPSFGERFWWERGKGAAAAAVDPSEGHQAGEG